MRPGPNIPGVHRRRSATLLPRHPVGGEAGSGSILALGVAAAFCAALVLSAPLYGGILLKRSLMNAADAAALAGASALLGAAPGAPCERAAEAAGVNGARLASCRVDGWTVRVTVTGTAAGFPLSGIARAGLRDPPVGAGSWAGGGTGAEPGGPVVHGAESPN